MGQHLTANEPVGSITTSRNSPPTRPTNTVDSQEQDEDAGTPTDLELGLMAGPGGPLDGVDLEKTESLATGAKNPGQAPAFTTTGNDADDFPDGGWQAWLCVLGAWSISLVSWGLVNSFNVFQSYYSQNQLSDKPADVIGWIASIQICLVMLCGLFVGRAFDAGWCRSLMILATVVYMAGFFSLPYCKSFGTIFVAQGLAMGAAPGIAFLPAVSSISHWFRRRRAFVLGIFSTGASIGGICYPLLLNKLLYSDIGFGWTIRIAAFFTLFFLLLAVAFVKQRLPPRKGRGHFVDIRVFKDPAYSFIVAGASIVMLGLYVPFTYLQTYAESQNLDRTITLYAASILSAASVFGRLIPNYLADSLGPISVLAFNTIVSGVLIFCWIPLGKTTAGLVVFCVLFGFASGTQVSMAPACIASITTNFNEIGVRMAMCYLAIALLALPGPPIAGAIVNTTGSYVGAACFSAGSVLVGAACYLTAMVLVARRKNKWRV